MTKKIFIHIVLLAVFTLPLFALAQSDGSQNIKIDNPFKTGGTLEELISAILNNVLLPIAAVLAVCYIIWSGFKYVQAQGNPAKIKEANQRLLYVLIGTGILLGAVGINAVVRNTVNQFVK